MQEQNFLSHDSYRSYLPCWALDASAH